MNRLFQFASLLLVPSGLGLTGCTEEATEARVATAPAQRGLPPVVTDTVRLAPVQTELRLSGQVTANADHTTPVYALVGGVVEQVPVALGDQVQKGQVLAVVRSTEVASLEQERAAATIAVHTAQQQLTTTSALHHDGLASAQELAGARATLRRAQAELRRVQQQPALLATEQGRYLLRAPRAGVVTAKSVSAGTQFAPEQVGALFTLTDLDEVWVLADVFQADIPHVRVGLPAVIRTLSYPDQPFTGQVDKVFSLLRPDSKSLQVRVRLANAGHLLKPGMYTQVRLRSTSAQQLPTVPAGSLVFANGRRYAMVMKNAETVETRPVVAGHTVGGISYVHDGLRPGEQVVTGNPLLLYKELND